MLPKLSGSNHFNAYYHDNSLLIQFVVTEFVHTHQLSLQIRQWAHTQLQSSDMEESCIIPLLGYMSQLLGTMSHQDKLSITHWTKGPLTKLREYCEQFSRNELHRDKKGMLLHQYVQQAWLSALQNLDLLKQIQEPQFPPLSASICQSVKRRLFQLDRQLKLIAQQLPRVVKSYHNNENVLFFLLRKSGLLSQVYGPYFMKDIFKAAFKKEQDWISLLTHRYTERGFQHLLPFIHS